MDVKKTKNRNQNNIYDAISPKKLVILLIILIAIIIVVFVLISHRNKSKEKPDVTSADAFTKVTVVKVADGDAIWVKVGDSTKKVRLIGVNTPEINHYSGSKVNTPGGLAKAYVEGLIKEDQTVYLQKDVSDEDSYDRLIRYVWLEMPDDALDSDEIEDKMLNAKILLAGYGEAAESETDLTYLDVFKSYQKEATDNQLGIWAPTN